MNSSVSAASASISAFPVYIWPASLSSGTYDLTSTRSIAVNGPAAMLLKTEERTADIAALGDSNLIIYAASAATGDVDLLVKEIGRFDGTIRLPDCSLACYLDISDGEYTISIP